MTNEPDTAEPTLKQLLDKAKDHVMTEAMIDAQRQSWIRSMGPCEHGNRDFEQCGECRK
jgi:hypothetical protein